MAILAIYYKQHKQWESQVSFLLYWVVVYCIWIKLGTIQLWVTTSCLQIKNYVFNQRINIFSSITKHLTLIAIKWSKLWYWFCGLQMSKLIDEGVIVLKVQNFLFKLVYLVCIKWESYLENFILLHWRFRTLQPWSWEICLKRDFCNSCSLIWWDLCWSIWLLHVHHYLLCYLHQFPYRWKLCTRIGSIV